MKKLIALAFAFVLIAGACGQSPEPSPPTKPSPTEGTGPAMKVLAAQTKQSYQLVLPPSDFVRGQNRVAFAILAKDQSFVPNRKLQLYYGKSESAEAQGPEPVTFEEDGLGDRAFYRAKANFSSPGKWLLLVTENSAEGRVGAGTQIEVHAKSSVPKIGEKAVSLATPTVADHKGVVDICTSKPEDPMHDVSLDQALANGKPTVFVIGTPAFCASRVCGPVVNQVLRVREQFQPQANFVHAEVWEDKPGGKPTQAMQQWNLTTEPWTFVIDKTGVVRDRFEGPVTTGEIASALEKLV